MRRRVVIIGGGISGLAAAHHVRELDPELDVLLLEAGKRLGGVIQTAKRAGFLIESAADNFITSAPAAVDLCHRLGVGDSLIPTNAAGRRALVLCKGSLKPIPAGFLVMAPSRLWPLMTTPILSTFGKARAGYEWFIPRKASDEDESLQSFVCRRFGREMFERLVQPLVGGIYTADPERLSVAATMPRFLQMEREHGSLIRAMLRQRRSQTKQHESSGGARYHQFVTLRGGMSSLIDALAKQLPAGSVRLRSPVCSIVRDRANWAVRIARGRNSWVDADGVIVAAPASRASEMLATVDSRMANELRRIEYASCAVVSLAYRREQIGHPLAFGFVVPEVENRYILSCSFSSIKYEGRAPEGAVLMRVFIGGASQAGLLRLPQDQLIELAEIELSKMLDIKGEPILRRVTRQSHAMPQYHVGHCDRVAQVEQRLERFPTLALAGSAFHGVGVPGCIQSGEAAAHRVVSALASANHAAAESVSNEGDC